MAGERAGALNRASQDVGLFRSDTDVDALVEVVSTIFELFAIVICELLGVPVTDHERFGIGNGLWHLWQNADQLYRCQASLKSVVQGWRSCCATTVRCNFHHCIGAPLAPAEAEVALGALFDRLPRLRVTLDEPCWKPILIFRGLRELPVRWD